MTTIAHDSYCLMTPGRYGARDIFKSWLQRIPRWLCAASCCEPTRRHVEGVIYFEVRVGRTTKNHRIPRNCLICLNTDLKKIQR